MIEKISIRNFQRHKKITVDFTPECNILIGHSDVGKSAIIRALRWIFTNKPSGDSFIKWGKEYTKVTVFIDGHRVIRKRSKTENLYSLDGKVYKSFGNEVPEEIAAILNIDESINISVQTDPPTWMTLPPSQVSKELNRIVNLQSIDNSLSNALAEVRKAKSVVEVSESRLKEAKKKRDNLAWVREWDEELQGLEKQGNKLTRLQSRITDLSSLLTEIEEWEGKANKEIPDISTLESSVFSIIEMEKQVGKLSELLEEIEATEERIASSTSELEQAEAELKEQMSGTCPLCGGEYVS